MSQRLRNLIQNLAGDFDREDGCAFDLWTWLPSHKVAENYHGDYASSFTPSIAFVLAEAAFVLAEHAGYEHTSAERAKYEECPCGEGCEQGKQEEKSE